MEKAYKGIMGGYSVWKEGNEKHEATHVVLTNDEYQKMRREKKAVEQKLEDKKVDYARRIKELREEANGCIQAAVRQRDEVQAKSDEIIRKCEQERDEALALNVNLKRICRERANAKRGLKPKKKHSGFVIVRTQEARDRIPLRKGYRDLRVYKTTVETPYSVHLAISQAEPMAWADGLQKIFDSAWQDHDANNLEDALENHSSTNFVYRQEWQTGRNDLWEIVCYHTKPITMAVGEEAAGTSGHS